MILPFNATVVEQAYRHGIFPMDLDGDIYWYRPDPRAVIPLESFHVSRSLARTIRQGKYRVTVNQDFVGVMRACADRLGETWIGPAFFDVYSELHEQGKAHSIEAWLGDELAGGTYGVCLGGAFMAESMFHRHTDAGKVALAKLVELMKTQGLTLLDVQYLTPNLAGLGAVEISHAAYMRRLRAALKLEVDFAPA